MLIGVYIWKTVPLDVDKRDLARMAAAAALGVALTLFAAPRTNRIFYDEQIYQSVGQNLADLRLAQVCNDGSVEYGRLRCASGEYNKQPYGYPHALSLAYRLFGAHAGTAFGLNAVAMGLTVCAVYLLVWVLFRDRDAALFAGLLIALTPAAAHMVGHGSRRAVRLPGVRHRRCWAWRTICAREDGPRSWPLSWPRRMPFSFARNHS